MLQLKSKKLASKISKLPDQAGVYLMKDKKGRVIYIGKARRLRERVRSYFQASAFIPPKNQAMLASINNLDYLVTDSEVDALLLEARLIRDIQPRYNVMLRDDKTFPLIAITQETFPHVYLTRERGRKNTYYYGPFTNAREVRHALKILQRIFKFRTCGLVLRDKYVSQQQRPRTCLLYHIDHCSAPCENKINPLDYQESIRSLRAFLKGNKRSLLKRINLKMKTLSKSYQFERAARYRDQTKALKNIAQLGRLGEFYELSLGPSNQERLEDLKKLLGLDKLPRQIEGVDISDIKGKEAVGSLVTFIDGAPFKDGYRRYKIKWTQEGKPDDYQRMKEVLLRRYQRFSSAISVTTLNKTESSLDILPNILLIDGGEGHLRIAQRVFKELKVKPPLLVALAKGKYQKKELLHVSNRFESKPISPKFIGYGLLQYVRDEAHRFAHKYHLLLRKKKALNNSTQK